MAKNKEELKNRWDNGNPNELMSIIHYTPVSAGLIRLVLCAAARVLFTAKYKTTHEKIETILQHTEATANGGRILNYHELLNKLRNIVSEHSKLSDRAAHHMQYYLGADYTRTKLSCVTGCAASACDMHTYVYSLRSRIYSSAGLLNTKGKNRLAATLRDVLGNPFEKILLGQPWRQNNDVKALTRGLDHKVPATFSILADALEDAGCDYQRMLDHLRTPLHTPSCWVKRTLLYNRKK